MHEAPRLAKPEREWRMLAARGSGEGMGSWCFWRTNVQFRKLEKFWSLAVMMVVQQHECTQRLCALKNSYDGIFIAIKNDRRNERTAFSPVSLGR